MWNIFVFQGPVCFGEITELQSPATAKEILVFLSWFSIEGESVEGEWLFHMSQQLISIM